ncbi:hypothetical protein R1sor_010694 [Riccia sorocarpa]|uniref:DDE Tnp4 domain-containing protein n=1 Tax=Riccia sorocarpa TaxID=122646 RepID=A0ABD3HYT4_9MARC
MNKSSFYKLLDIVGQDLSKQNTRFWRSVRADVCLGIILYRLACVDTYFDIGEKFDVGESTISDIVLEGVHLLCSIMGPKYLKWPGPRKLRKVSEGFEALCGLPNIQGAIYYSLVKIRAPVGISLAVVKMVMRMMMFRVEDEADDSSSGPPPPGYSAVVREELAEYLCLRN